MAEVRAPDGVRLHVETDGTGDPVSVFAHGLTNACTELAAFTPMAPGTAVRFCFRGHGHSEVSPAGTYGFADLAGDLRAVADAFGATRAVGTSMGAGAITRVLGEEPDRFERVVLLLPAALDGRLPEGSIAEFDRTADLLETLPLDRAIEQILIQSGRERSYEVAPWLRELDLALWHDLNPVGVARAIRQVVREAAIADRELLRKVSAPVLLICREGDSLHPAELGGVLADLFPNAELIMLGSEAELVAAIPQLVQRVAAFLV
jgi:pimeloyl-ACP methyl ester carboxylesterase